MSQMSQSQDDKILPRKNLCWLFVEFFVQPTLFGMTSSNEARAF